MKECSIAGCSSPAKSKSYCYVHYNRWKRKGDANAPVRHKFFNETCLAQGCLKPTHSHGYCSKHSSRMTKHGDIDRSDRHFWKDTIHKHLYHNAKHRAHKAGLEFSLRPEDITVPKSCPVLGIVLERKNGKIHDGSPTIDRINNKKGYTKENIVIVSYLANRIKSNASIVNIAKVVRFYEALTNV